MLNDTDRNMLKIAYDEALLGFEQVDAQSGQCWHVVGEVSRGHNQRVQQGDPIAHGEMDARKAGRQKTYRDTVLYTTLSLRCGEPLSNRHSARCDW